MATVRLSALDDFLKRYADHPGASDLIQHWWKIEPYCTADPTGNLLIAFYESVTRFLEELLWGSGCPDAVLELYQSLFREMESEIASSGTDTRFEFVVVIPVADRPQHLESCLDSLLSLCQGYGYGGISNGSYRKLTVLIADDSKEAENISRHQATLERFSRRGLNTVYFGQSEQLQQLDLLSPELKNGLSQIIGENQPRAFYHKGASITRNITSLKLAALAEENDHRLFWFMDSDQEFQVNTGSGDRKVDAINYFHQLNQIFSTTDTRLLTGKVVGDPPVSPAVMAGNFLEDVIGFLTDIAQLQPQQACQFHAQENLQGDDASYHDMANLFGYKAVRTAARYCCKLSDPHDHAGCLADFSQKLNRFFDGEHPTRQTQYEHQQVSSSLVPARTVYTGNYVFRASALEYFIPFAALKLRMAGPVLGRLLQAEMGKQFVSANLPMLHKRTVDQLGQSEFRPDIDRKADLIDLSGEFERQFYGDVMLFSIEGLTAQGYPSKPLAEQSVRQTLHEVETSMRQKYSDTQTRILERLGRLKTLFDDAQHWWQREPDCQTAKANFLQFIRNMEYNFGDDSPGYRMINSENHQQRRLNELFEAIMQLPQDRINWRQALATVDKAAQARHRT